MVSPNEFIKNLRQNKFQLDIDLSSANEQLRATIIESRANLHASYNGALELLAKDLFSKDTHFVLELVQNADDNEYPEGVVPQLEFLVGSDKLIVWNNEAGFREANVNALCDSNNSTKKGKKAEGFIGEKGIGFKSVFKVSNRPEIHSNGFHFRFDVSDEQNLLGYVVPELIDKADKLVQGHGTSIVLPAKAGYLFSEKDLTEVSPEILLFLKRLRNLKVVKSDAGRNTTLGSYELSDSESITSIDVVRTSSAGSTPRQETLRYMKLSFSLPIDPDLEEKRKGITETEIVLAYPLKPDLSAKTTGRQKVFAFLPIRNYGFKFLIQGDFLLTASREGLHEGNAWNEAIRDAIPYAFVLSIESFKQHPTLAKSFFGFIPRPEDILDSFFEPIPRAITSALSEAECLLTQGGNWRKPQKVLTDEGGGRKLITNAELHSMLDLEFLVPDFIVEPTILAEIGCSPFRPTHLVECLRNEDWAAQKSDQWFADFFLYLNGGPLPNAFRSIVQQVKCFRIGNGQLTRLSDGPIFFPLEKKRRYGFEDSLRVLSLTDITISEAEEETLYGVLSQLGITEASPKRIIDDYIVPLYESDQWKSIGTEALVGHIRYIKDNLSAYLSGENEDERLAYLGSRLWLRTEGNSAQGNTLYGRANNLYFSDDYGPEIRISSYLNQGDPNGAAFLSADYLPQRKEKSELRGEKYRPWREFFCSLGVAELPRVVKKTLFPNGHDFVPEKFFEAILNSSKLEEQLVRLVEQHWASYYSQFAAAAEPKQMNRYRTYLVERPSAFVQKLAAMEVPTTSKKVVRLSDTYLDRPELRDIFGNAVPYLKVQLHDESFMSQVGITHKTDVHACIKRLTQFCATKQPKVRAIERVYKQIAMLADRHGDEIRSQFTTRKLIYAPDADEGTWCLPSEVVWNSHGSFLDEVYPALQNNYRELKTFFVQKIGVKLGLTAERLVGALPEVEATELDASEKWKAAYDIYSRLDKMLRQERTEDSNWTRPDWLDDVRNGLLMDTEGDLYASDEIYVNDRADISVLFPDVPFLGGSTGQLGQIRALIEACELTYLSHAVTRSVDSLKIGTVDQDLSDLVRRRADDILRIVYSRSQDALESLVQSRRHEDLRQIFIRRPSKIPVRLQLGDVAATSDSELTYSDEDTILIVAECRGVKDKLAQEMCRYLGIRESFSDIFSLIFHVPDEEVDEVLVGRGIVAIPEEIASKFFGNEEQLKLPGGKRDDSELIPQDSTPESDAEVAEAVTRIGPDSSDFIDVVRGSDIGTPDRELVSATVSQAPAVERDDGQLRNRPEDTVKRAAEANSLMRERELLAEGQNQDQEPSNGSVVDRRSATAKGDLEPQNQSARRELRDGQRATTGLGVDGESMTASNDRTRVVDPTVRLHSGVKSPTQRQREQRASRDRVISYVYNGKNEPNDDWGGSGQTFEERKATGQLAVNWIVDEEQKVGRRWVPQEFENEGYDLKLTLDDGSEHYAEVKGTRGPWTEAGMVVSPAQIRFAASRPNVWLFVVEFVGTSKQRLYRIRDPFGKATQFRFDCGWKQLAEGIVLQKEEPEVGMFVDIPREGHAKIVSVKQQGVFFKIGVQFVGTNETVFRRFIPNQMKLSIV